jgi:hypothetical protein
MHIMQYVDITYIIFGIYLMHFIYYPKEEKIFSLVPWSV